MRDLVFVSMENWDEVWRRNQFLCAGLARRFPTTKILFVGLPIDVSHNLRHGKLPSGRAQIITPVPDYPNILLTNPLKLVPNSLTIGRKLNEARLRSHLRRAMRTVGIKAPLLWLNPHSAVHLAGHLGECALIYDITDDWALASFSGQEKRLIEAQDQLLYRLADLVIVCSEALAKSRRGFCKKLLLLPNGVHVEHYRCVAQATPERNASWPAPVFGYTGTLHPDRVDMELIVALARAFPAGSVVLIGPDNLNAANKATLAAYQNIHVTGAVPYQQIPACMEQFDVCIVPHLESAFTESLNPIKLWEYLAAGKPIVSTNVAGFRSFAHLCHIASGPEAFIKACQTALGEGCLGQAERMAEAAKHSWDARLDCLSGALEELGAI